MQETKSCGATSHNFGLMVVILLLKFNCYKLSESVHSDYYSAGGGSGGNVSHSIFRFRDFEPRYLNNDNPAELLVRHPEHRFDYIEGGEYINVNNSERHGRGFHFSATGEDVSVEMEFIIPFVKVPVKRSMALARSAVQGLLNLRTGALINTLVIVVAGASIAGIIKLLSTILSVGTPGLTYGYKSAKAEGEHNKKARGFAAVLESKLDEHNIDVSACLQRSICAYLQRNRQTLYWSEDTAGYAKLIDAIARHPYLDTFLAGTAIHDAIKASKAAESCEQVYHNCRMHLSSEQFKPLLRYLRLFNG